MTKHQLLILQRHLRNVIRCYELSLGMDKEIREYIEPVKEEAQEILAHVEELIRAAT